MFIHQYGHLVLRALGKLRNLRLALHITTGGCRRRRLDFAELSAAISLLHDVSKLMCKQSSTSLRR